MELVSLGIPANKFVPNFLEQNIETSVANVIVNIHQHFCNILAANEILQFSKIEQKVKA